MAVYCCFGGMIKKMKIAVCPGSFDPVTKGHIDIIKRASGMFDSVVVAISINPSKTPSFTLEERADQLRRCVSGLNNVSVETQSGLIAEYARDIGACAIVKGIRSASDYEYEYPMAAINKKINEGLETVFLAANENYAYISSSLVKQIASFGGDISYYVPEEIYTEVLERLGRKEN